MKAQRASAAALTLGAIGVVFGDIGTSPIYALQVLFGAQGQLLTIDRLHVYGVVSLIIWCITLIVSIKYVGFLMHIDSKGEGGIMALLTFARRGFSGRKRKLLLFIGIVGVALFYGDSVITPAISVLSAIEGIEVTAPNLHSFILPITLTVLVFLFWLQRYGTNVIGRLFGPVMVVWFLAIGIVGAWHIMQYPGVLVSLSPLAAISFVAHEPVVAFFAMTAVVLAITGVEALYADMGHFGRKPISYAWFVLVFPALALCYMGQGALLLQGGATATHGIFFQLFPNDLQIFIVILATFATLIASQSVISGTFSLTRQAIQLNLLPRMQINYTSSWTAGQIYVPMINSLLFISVCSLVLFFGSSERLAHAFGMAVSGTLLASTVLFLAVMRVYWHASWMKVISCGVPFIGVETVFVLANATKLPHGAWIALVIGCVAATIMITWLRGQDIISGKRRRLEGKLEVFIRKVKEAKIPIPRIPGQVVYIGYHHGYTPLALHASVDDLHELHEKAVIVYVETVDHAHVPKERRATFNSLGYDDGISELILRYGYQDRINIVEDLENSRHLSSELDFNPEDAAYFISVTEAVPSAQHNLPRWQKRLYAFLARNAVRSSDYYNLPIEKTVEARTPIEL